MDRQLSVWAAPGLVLLVALIAVLSGHLPRGLMPASHPRPIPRPAPIAAPPAGTPVTAPAEQVEPAKPAVVEKPAPKPSAPRSTVAYDGPAGVVAGRIVFDGAPPAPKPELAVSEKDLATCCADAMDRRDRSLLVGDSGGVADVVVMIKAAGAEAAGAGTEVVMDQKCCRFEPHVIVVPQGGSVRYLNSDDFNHNVHTESKKARAINNNVSGGTSTVTVLEQDEVFPVICDIHTWMKAHVFVTEYATTAVTDADGSFRIEGVPPGEWNVELWSETLKNGKQKVVVQQDATTTVEWKLARK